MGALPLVGLQAGHNLVDDRFIKRHAEYVIAYFYLPDLFPGNIINWYLHLISSPSWPSG
jgi:hypothetical protein